MNQQERMTMKWCNYFSSCSVHYTTTLQKSKYKYTVTSINFQCKTTGICENRVHEFLPWMNKSWGFVHRLKILDPDINSTEKKNLGQSVHSRCLQSFKIWSCCFRTGNAGTPRCYQTQRNSSNFERSNNWKVSTSCLKRLGSQKARIGYKSYGLLQQCT